jgi:hypothetical protein
MACQTCYDIEGDVGRTVEVLDGEISEPGNA